MVHCINTGLQWQRGLTWGLIGVQTVYVCNTLCNREWCYKGRPPTHGTLYQYQPSTTKGMEPRLNPLTNCNSVALYVTLYVTGNCVTRAGPPHMVHCIKTGLQTKGIDPRLKWANRLLMQQCNTLCNQKWCYKGWLPIHGTLCQYWPTTTKGTQGWSELTNCWCNSVTLYVTGNGVTRVGPLHMVHCVNTGLQQQRGWTQDWIGCTHSWRMWVNSI